MALDLSMIRDNVSFLQLQRLRTANMGFDVPVVLDRGKPLPDLNRMAGEVAYGRSSLRHSPALSVAAAGEFSPPSRVPHGFLQTIHNELADNAGNRERLLLAQRLAANNAERERLLIERRASREFELAHIDKRIAHQRMVTMMMTVLDTPSQKDMHLLNNNQQKMMILNNQRIPITPQSHESLELASFTRLQPHQARSISGSGVFNGTVDDSGIVIQVASSPQEEEEHGNEEHEETTDMPTKQRKRNVCNKWRTQYDKLVEYEAEHGNCIVPRGYLIDPRLAAWVAEQRKQYKFFKDDKGSTMTQRRIDLLNAIGFVWNAQEAAWERHLADLVAFKEEYGSWVVPMYHPTYPKLGLWVKEMRRHRNLLKRGMQLPSRISEERVRRLEEVGFGFDDTRAVWGEKLEALCQYKAKFGDCNVPLDYPDRLGSWVEYVRRQNEKCLSGESSKLTPGRAALLSSMGFIWKTTNLGARPPEGNTTCSAKREVESDSGWNAILSHTSKRRRFSKLATS